MISIIVPTLNRANFLRSALQSFCQQNFPSDQYEILVIDNGSTDNTRAVTSTTFDAYPSIQSKYVYEPEPGSTAARHRGALEAKGNIFTFADDDIQANPNWLRAINTSFNDSTVQLVGGPSLPKYEVEPPEWIEWFWDNGPLGKNCFYLSLLDFGDQIREIDPTYIWGLNFSIRNSALFELKGFLPDIFPSHLQHLQGSGETGLAGEAKRRDFKAIYHPEALVYHHVQRERMTYRYFEKRFYFAGIDGSYSSIRATYTFRKIDMVSHVVKKHLKLLRTGYFYIKIRSYPAKRAALCRRFWRAEQKGRKFHQDAVRQHPDILDWIQKSDYWDCGEMVQRLTYPDLYN